MISKNKIYIRRLFAKAIWLVLFCCSIFLSQYPSASAAPGDIINFSCNIETDGSGNAVGIHTAGSFQPISPEPYAYGYNDVNGPPGTSGGGQVSQSFDRSYSFGSGPYLPPGTYTSSLSSSSTGATQNENCGTVLDQAYGGGAVSVSCTLSGPTNLGYNSFWGTDAERWGVNINWSFQPHPSPPYSNDTNFGTFGYSAPYDGGTGSTGNGPTGSTTVDYERPSTGEQFTITAVLNDKIGGSVSGTCSGTSNSNVPSVSLGASPNPVPYNTPTTLTWSSQNTTSCTATAGAGFSTGGGTSGSDGSDNLVSTETFTVTCSGPGGVASDSTTVNVNLPPLSCNLSGSTTIQQGGSVNASATGGIGSYSWSTPGANSSGNGANLGLQYTTPGTYSVDVSTPSSGQSAHCGDVTVNPNGPYVNLYASPNPVNSGNPTTLTWDAGYVSSCTATQGAGFSTGGATSGSDVSSSLTAAEVFTVTCTGTNGTASDTVTVYVNTPPGSPPSCSSSAPQASNTTAISGVFYVYAYGVTGATSVTFPTWGDTGGQDDLVNYPGTNLGSGTWRAGVNLANHKTGNPEYGNINSHVYMANASYPSTWCGTANFTRTYVAPSTLPSVSIIATPSTGTYPQSVVLSWVTSGSPTSCTAGGEWSGSKNIAGSSENIGNPSVGSHTYNIYCTNSAGNSPTDSATVVISASAPTAVLTASPNPVTYGASSTLSWSSTNTTSCVATQGAGFSTSGLTSGSDLSAGLTQTETFAISCTGSNGSTVTPAAVTVNVTTPTLSCSLSSYNIQTGQSVTATANNPVPNSSALVWTWGGGASTYSQSGNTFTVYYTVPGTYTISATTSAQGSVNCNGTVTVTSPPAPSVNLTASVNSGTYPTPVTLSWVTANSPTSCTASSSHSDWTGSKNIAGTSEAIGNPIVGTHTYTISCSNSSGTDSDTQTVVISNSAANAPGVTLTASPTSGTYPQTETLTWVVTNSPDTCTASSTDFIWAGGKSTANGSHSETVASPPVGTTTYTITCVKSGYANAVANASVNLASPPPAVTLSVASNPIPYNTQAQLFWTSTYATTCTATGGSGFSTGGATSGSDYSSNLTASETFTIVCVGPTGPPASDSKTVNVGSQPSLPVSCTVTTPSPLYTNTPITATATGGLAPLSWSVPGGSPSTGNSASFTSQFSSPGNYQFTVTSAGSPQQTGSCFAFVVAAPPSPGVTIWATPTSGVYAQAVSISWITTNSPTSCVASGAWSGSKDVNGNLFGESVGTPSVGVHQYTITCSNATGPPASDTATVTITAAPVLTCTPASQTVLLNQSSAKNASGGIGSYSWSAPGGSVTSGSGSSFSTAYSTTGTKTITLTSGVQTVTCSVVVNAPTLTCSASPLTVAINQNTTLTATGGTGTYSWSAPAGTPSSGSASTLTTQYSASGTKTVTVTSNSVSSTCTVTVTPPTVTIQASPTSGTYPTVVTLTWTPGNSPTSCTASSSAGDWTGAKSSTNGPHSETVTPPIGTSSYTIICTKGSSTVSDTQSVTISAPAVTCSPSTQNIYVGQATSTMTAGGGTGSYTWSAVGGSPSSGSAGSFSTTYASTGTKTVSVSSGTGSANCTVTVTSAPTPPTITLSASPTSVVYTSPITLTWTPGNSPDSCTASSSLGNWTGAKSFANGTYSEPITPPVGTSNYTMTCSKGSLTASDTVSVTVTAPSTMTCSLSPTTVYVGSPTTATAVNGVGTYAWTAFGGTVTGSGSSVTVNYASPGTYAVSVATSAGQSASCGSVTVNTPAPNLTNSNKDIVSVNGTAVSFHETDGAAEANVQNLSIAEGAQIGFKVHIVNSGSASKTGSFTVTDVLSNLAPPTGGWSLSNVNITCNNLSCAGRYSLTGVSYNSGTKTAVFTIASTGGTLAPSQFISVAYTAVTQGPTSASENVFRFLNTATIDFSDGSPQLNCGSLSTCPLKSPLVLFFRRLAVPFLKEVQ